MISLIKHRVLKFIVLSTSFAWLVSCQSQEPFDTKETRFMLGTIVEFTVFHSDENTALKAILQASQAMQEVEHLFTIHGETENTVQAFNRAPVGRDILLDEEVNKLLQQSIVFYQQTEGAFDPTLGELSKRWGFSGVTKPSKPLNSESIKAALNMSGVEFILKEKPKNTWKKSKDLKLDFGAIAKGLAIDKGVSVLSEAGIKHAIINAGGDMRVIGDHGGKPWKVGIRHPRQTEPLGWLSVSKDMSIVTSGDYERYFIHEGKRYHHIIDPATGLPSSMSMSVTVIAPTAVEADALSTAMFILGYKKGLTLVEGLVGVEALWVDDKQEIHMSSGIERWLHATPSSNH